MRIFPNPDKGPDNLKELLTVKNNKMLILTTLVVTLAIMVIMLSVAVIIIAAYPKSQGYVIEITPEGESIYNPDAITTLEEWEPNANTVNYFLRNWLTYLRSVSSDPQIVQQNVTRLYQVVTGTAADKATEYIEATDPIARSRNETVTIKIASILPLSESTYQIDFRETVFTTQRTVRSDDHYRAVVHTALYTPRTIEQQTYNPIGLYVTDFDITMVKEI